MIDSRNNHSAQDKGSTDPRGNGGVRLVIASLAVNVILLGVLVGVLYLAKYHREVLTNTFAQQHGHALAACLLLLWLSFSAVVDGLFSPTKRHEMEPGKRRAHLAFLAIGVPLSIATYFNPILTGACFICLGAKLLAEDYFEYKGRGHRWDYRLEHILWGIAFILIGTAMYFL